MRWHSLFFLGLSAALVSATLFGLTLGKTATLVLLAGSVGTLGVAHGAFDLVLARRLGLWRRWPELLGFLVLYLLLIVAALRAWWLAPGAVLGVFLAMSVWHFAADWEGSLPLWARVAAAAAIVVLPVWAHPQAVESYFSALVPEATAAAFVSFPLSAGPAVLTATLAAAPG